MQVEKNLEGAITPCGGCGRQPKHVNTRGRDLHHLECPPCQVRTQKFSSLQEAVAAWEKQDTAQIEMRR